MSVLDDFIKMVKKQCDDDDVCIMVVFVLIGFMLCYLFKNQISGYMNFAGGGEDMAGQPMANGMASGAAGGMASQPMANGMASQPKADKKVGIELQPRKPDPTPSTMKQLDIMASKPPVERGSVEQQVGLKIQNAGIFRPFDEIWNPGFMPLDMVFKGVESSGMGQDRPMGPPKPNGMGPDRPMGNPSQMGNEPTGEDVNLVLVYAPWCGHSKRMLPDYERIKSEYDGKTVNGKKVNVLMYDSDVDKDKVKEYGVRGFPSLFLEKNGNRESFPHRQYEKIKDALENL